MGLLYQELGALGRVAVWHWGGQLPEMWSPVAWVTSVGHGEDEIISVFCLGLCALPGPGHTPNSHFITSQSVGESGRCSWSLKTELQATQRALGPALWVWMGKLRQREIKLSPSKMAREGLSEPPHRVSWFPGSPLLSGFCDLAAASSFGEGTGKGESFLLGPGIKEVDTGVSYRNLPRLGRTCHWQVLLQRGQSKGQVPARTLGAGAGQGCKPRTKAWVNWMAVRPKN